MSDLMVKGGEHMKWVEMIQLRDGLGKQAARAKGLIYLVHGTDTLPQGYAAAF